MKKLFLILLLTSMSYSGVLTVVGLSGSRYEVALTDDNMASSRDLLKKLNMRNSISGDTLNVKYNSSTLRFISGDTTAVIDSSVVSLSRAVKSKKDLFYIPASSLPKTLSLLTGLSFRYNETRRELSIHREPAEYLELTGKVVLDPGHGGKDPGAIGQAGYYEKDAVLAISLKTAEYLREHSGLTVLLSREDDTFLALGERTQFANDHEADLFLSVHANSSPKKDRIGGYKMYFLSDAKNEADDRIAKMENAAIEFEESSNASTDVLQSVLRDMINNEYLKESQDLSIKLEEAFRDGLPNVESLHTGVGQANFYVLNGALMPAVLVEVCFISNSEEEKMLQDDKFHTKVAQAMGRAILRFRKKQKELL